ncbi:MAG: SGNH/GDSL hydrolase family protein [Alphaproteobacteria bacterium]|nr:SGNH/GDSL hydrolase family protein [Alphaproteobacteria bacterium]
MAGRPAAAAIRMAALAASLAASAACPAQARDVGARDCAAPVHAQGTNEALPKLAAKLKAGGPVAVAVVGTSRALPGGDSRSGRLLDDQFRAAWQRTFPRSPVELRSRIVPESEASRIVAEELPAVAAAGADLVLWHAGGADARGNESLKRFKNALTDGVRLLRKAGSEVLLVAPRQMPRSEGMVNMEPYQHYIEAVGDRLDVPVLRRHAILQHWIDSGMVDLTQAGSQAQRAELDFVHACMGMLIVDVLDRLAR